MSSATRKGDTTVVEGFDPKSWDMVGAQSLSRQLPTGEVLIELARRGRDDVVVLTADLGRPTRVHDFGARYPKRYFNFGIAERNMIGAAAGLATTGLTPFVSNYGFFLALMGCENIRNDVCYPNLKVRMVGTHSGIAMGFYGTSHHSCEDIAVLRTMANMTLMAPCDANAIRAALPAMIDHPGPVYFRVGRGRETPVYDAPPDWRAGGSHTLGDGRHATVLAIGNLVRAALDARDLLAAEGIGLRVVDMYSIRPLDTRPVLEAAKDHGVIFSAEEHNVTGGFGAAVAEVLAESRSAARLCRIGVPDEYALLGPPTHLYRHYGLDGEGIARTVRKELSQG
jgi:transketolase